MRTHLVLAAILLPGGVLHAADPVQLPAWLDGRWCAASGEETIEELWLPAAGSMMLGLSRTYTKDGTIGFEYLRIVERDGTLQYLAQPGGNPPTAFTMTDGGEHWLRFENAEHDFPKRIEYRREGARLHAEVAGPGDGNSELVIVFDYRPCGK